MVQKKVPNKLGIKDDHVKTDKGLLAKLKQSISQQHDGKNRGVELKKKMKKSKSIKGSNLESCLSPPPPGKPPQPGGFPGGFPGGATSGGSFPVPKKQSSAKLAGGSPPLLQTRKLPPPQQPMKQEPPPQAGKQQKNGGSFLVPKKQSPVRSTEGSPNYMKSTSSFEARKEECSRSPASTFRSPQPSISPKTLSPKQPINSNHKSASSSKGSRSLSRTYNLKLVRTLTKSPSFKPPRSLSKKCSPVALCEDFDAQRATCSSTLKDSKFPNYLTLTHGATEAEGTSAMKVCPYTYCSLNGHHHSPSPPLKSFLSARRRVLKTQKSFKLGCLSPRRTSPRESDSKSFPIIPMVQEEGRDFFLEIYTKDCEGSNEKVYDDFEKNQEMEVNETVVCLPSSVQEEIIGDCFDDERDNNNFEGCDMDWEAVEFSKADTVDDSNCCIKELVPDEVMKELFDEESVDSEAWFDDQDSESDLSSTNLESYGFKESDNGFPKMVAEETQGACDLEEKELKESSNDGDLSCLLIGNQDSCQDLLEQEFAEIDVVDKIEKNESPCEDGYLDSSQDFLEHELPSDEVTDEMKEKESSQSGEEFDEPIQTFADKGLQNDTEDMSSNKPLQCNKNTNQEGDETKTFELSVTEEESKDLDKDEDELKSKKDEEEKIFIHEENTTKETKKQELYRRGNLKPESLEEGKYQEWGVRRKTITEETENEKNFNPREPNYLPLAPHEDAEKVDLRHQMVDERKNAEEWMVDFALRRAVNSLAPARKRKVALLVEAFEKVMPMPKYESHLMHNSSAFALSPRTIQACR